MRPVLLARRLDILLFQVSTRVGGVGEHQADVPRMRSCRVGKLSGLGLCLEALVNSISLG